jgi:hypothetical protein
MSWIHIDDVLEAISDGESRNGATFQIGWVRSSGPRKGSIKYVAKCRRGIPPGYKEDRVVPNMPDSPIKKKRGLHIDRGTLPLLDVEMGRYITPLTSHIVEFNLKKVKH